MSEQLQQLQAAFTTALRGGDEIAARAVVEQAHATGIDVSTIYYDIFAPGMITIGELWERNELSVAEEHLATAITERLIGQLSTAFNQPVTEQERGQVLLGCVAGERHALGLRMLSDLFRAQGWRVLYLGADVPDDDWTRLAVRFNADLVAISCSSRRLIPQVQALIAALRAAQPKLLILVGGAIFVQEPELWQAVGADLFHPSPLIAVTMATARHQVATDRQIAAE